MPQVYIMSGPSGCGKTSLCKAWLEAVSDLKLSVSCTTRAPRPAEKDGVDYHFLDESTFLTQVKLGAFLEHAQVHDHWYGTRLSDVQHMLSQGDDVLLEIDWQGAAQVAMRIEHTVRIFMMPPSIAVLRQRLQKRAQDSVQVIERRVTAAQAEMAHCDEADIQIVNDDFDVALQALLHLKNKEKHTHSCVK